MQSVRRNQSGLAAITVTLIILGIVTLITVGFATLMRREQRQALDQQLSTQAFYAAESGVNVAREYIDNTDPDAVPEVSRCDQTPSDIANRATLSDNVSFSCVLLDTSPTRLQTQVSTDNSWVMNIETKNNTPVNRLEISWQMPGSTQFAPPEWTNNGNNLLLPRNKWGSTTGVVRLMLMPDTTNRTALIDNTYQAFLYPNASSSATLSRAVPAAPSRTQQGTFINGNCDTTKTPYDCKVNLTGLTASSYTLRLRAIYNPALVTVQSYNASNVIQELKNGQAVIDSTGKAADIVRRIQVNVPLSDTNFPSPQFAVETFSTMCKRFFAWPGNVRNDIDSSNGDTPISDAQRQACEPI